MARNLKIGQKVRVKKVDPCEEHVPTMQAYIGKEGEIVVRLPAEMGLGAPMYRVKFDDMEALAFFARELDRIGV